MPREIIHGSLQGENPPANPQVVSVAWGRESAHLQIATVKDGEKGYRGWFVDLDRSAVNRLIRVLRKARDQAYGSDA